MQNKIEYKSLSHQVLNEEMVYQKYTFEMFKIQENLEGKYSAQAFPQGIITKNSLSGHQFFNKTSRLQNIPAEQFAVQHHPILKHSNYSSFMKGHNLKGEKTQLSNKPKSITIYLLDKNKLTKHTPKKKTNNRTPIRQMRTGKEGMASTDSD